MIDIHCHILPEIDDGAQNIEESIKMCQKAALLGVSGIVATPHMIPGEMPDDIIELINSKVQLLKDVLAERNINIDIYSGAEIAISHDLPELLEEGKLLTINNTNYVLIELPFDKIPLYVEDVLYKLQIKGYIPIIAHPERNREIAKDIEIARKYLQKGAYFQINLSSLSGRYGKKAKLAAKSLIKNGFVHFIASDSHYSSSKALGMSGAEKLTKKLMSKELLKIVTESNPKEMVLGKVIFASEVPGKNKRNYLKVIVIVALLFGMLSGASYYTINKVFNEIFEYTFLENFSQSNYGSMDDSMPDNKYAQIKRQNTYQYNEAKDNTAISTDVGVKPADSQVEANKAQEMGGQNGASSNFTITSEKIKKLEEIISISDKSRAVSIITRNISASQLGEIREMLKGGVTTAERARIEQIIKSSVKADERDKLKSIYSKYAGMLE